MTKIGTHLRLRTDLRLATDWRAGARLARRRAYASCMDALRSPEQQALVERLRAAALIERAPFPSAGLGIAQVHARQFLGKERCLLAADTRTGFYEFNRRAGDFAMGMALVTFRLADGLMMEPRVGIGGAEAFPRLAGQLNDYVAKKLLNWSKERGQDPAKPDNSAIMEPIAHGLTEAQVQAVAAYLGNLE